MSTIRLTILALGLFITAIARYIADCAYDGAVGGTAWLAERMSNAARAIEARRAARTTAVVVGA